jgi:hypothetical protein
MNSDSELTSEAPIVLRELGRITAWFKKGSGTVVRSTLRAVPATVPDPFLNHARITKARSLGRLITWVSGHEEFVELDKTPPEFAEFDLDQCFEAIVERDSDTWNLRRVRQVHRTPDLKRLSEQVLTELWNSLPTTSTLPKSTRDWSQR